MWEETSSGREADGGPIDAGGGLASEGTGGVARGGRRWRGTYVVVSPRDQKEARQSAVQDYH